MNKFVWLAVCSQSYWLAINSPANKHIDCKLENFSWKNSFQNGNILLDFLPKIKWISPNFLNIYQLSTKFREFSSRPLEFSQKKFPIEFSINSIIRKIQLFRPQCFSRSFPVRPNWHLGMMDYFEPSNSLPPRKRSSITNPMSFEKEAEWGQNKVECNKISINLSIVWK